MSLFDAFNATPEPLPPSVRLTDPPTSLAASAVDRTSLRARVRSVLAAHPDGVTDWELCRLLGLPDHRKPTVGKRRQENDAVPVFDVDGNPVTRPSPNGMPCRVWTLDRSRGSEAA